MKKKHLKLEAVTFSSCIENICAECEEVIPAGEETWGNEDPYCLSCAQDCWHCIACDTFNILSEVICQNCGREKI